MRLNSSLASIGTKVALIAFTLSLFSPAQARAPREFKAQRNPASATITLPPIEPEIKAIQSFYVDYLNQNFNKVTPPALDRRGLSLFSTIFTSLVELNKNLCQRKATDEICGWSADGNPYLSAQDYGPGLNSKTANLSVAEIATTIPNHKMIAVKFTLDPTDKSARSQREMHFLIGLQKGKWVVDDLIAKDLDSSGKTSDYSSVESMRSEINTLFAMP